MMSFFAKSDMTGLRNLWLLFGGGIFANSSIAIAELKRLFPKWRIGAGNGN